MSSNPRFYLTNAIAYVNAAPHIGHALEAVQGDAITRYHREILGEETRFLVGTDEHGTKIAQTAEAQGKTPQELADENSRLFEELHGRFNTAHDDFIRTTSDRHKKGAQKIWKLIEAAGKFYEKEYEGLYCTGCEAFLPEKNLVEGKCPIHLRAPEVVREKNIFFKLSEYTEVLREKILSGEFDIQPQSRRNEFLALLDEGLQDVSFSRPKSSLSWGIEVPGHEDQVMYVWCDALTNYLTALGFAEEDELVNKFWPADVHLIGKDILRFHCGIWPAMLMAAGLPIPKAVWAHGFITSEGQKMSKSLGNVVSPLELLDEWGADPVRYYLLREIPTGDDGDYSRERFEVVYQDELQNTLGNLIRRVGAMTDRYLEGKVPEATSAMGTGVAEAWEAYHQYMKHFNIKMAIESLLNLARQANAYVEENKPWEIAKTGDAKRLAEVLGDLLYVCRELGRMLQPVMPETAQKISEQIGGEKIALGEPLFPRKEEPV